MIVVSREMNVISSKIAGIGKIDTGKQPDLVQFVPVQFLGRQNAAGDVFFGAKKQPEKPQKIVKTQKTAKMATSKSTTVSKPRNKGRVTTPGRSKRSEHGMVNFTVPLKRGFLERFLRAAASLDMNPTQYMEFKMPEFTVEPPKKRVITQVKTDVVGKHNGKTVKTHVQTLMGPAAIFDRWVKFINETEKYAQVALYDFDHVSVKGGRAVDGADIVPGWKKQQDILELIIKKARQGVRFQILLDNSVEYKYDEFRNPIFPRPINNEGMIDYLRRIARDEKLPIDVVAYPREAANIYHVKLLIADGKKAIVGGMNLSNHSAANWDACLSLEGPEVANIQASTFHPDWTYAKLIAMQDTLPPGATLPGLGEMRKMLRDPDRYGEVALSAENQALLAKIKSKLPKIKPVTDPAIRVLNTMPKEYSIIGENPREEIGDYLRKTLDRGDLKSVHSEQFIATHKEMKSKLINLHQSGKVKVKMLHSSSVIDQFPYSRKTASEMIRAGVPVRYYREWAEIQEKLHAKWTIFNDDEMMIGSANLSAAAVETNVGSGVRPDYPNHPGQRYERGNRDLAIVVKSAPVAKAFLKQFDYDWEYSPPSNPSAYGIHGKGQNLNFFKAVEKAVREALSKIPLPVKPAPDAKPEGGK